MTVRDCTVPRARHAEAGFSLLEGLIAAALLLLVLVSILPLFSQAMLNNLQGNDASYVSNGTVDGFERISSLPFDNFFINISDPPPNGDSDDTTTVQPDRWALQGDSWVQDISQSPVANDEVQFTRRATIQQFHIVDLTEDGILTNPLPAGTSESGVHIKVVRMNLTGQRRIGAPAFQAVLVKAK